jgi:hypothetical protein
MGLSCFPTFFAGKEKIKNGRVHIFWTITSHKKNIHVLEVEGAVVTHTKKIWKL